MERLRRQSGQDLGLNLQESMFPELTNADSLGSKEAIASLVAGELKRLLVLELGHRAYSFGGPGARRATPVACQASGLLTHLAYQLVTAGCPDKVSKWATSFGWPSKIVVGTKS